MSQKRIIITAVITALVCIVIFSAYRFFYLGERIDVGTMGVVKVTKNTDITIGSSVINVDIADTEISREKGLSGRNGLASSTGLLFVFDTDNLWGIWMKDMKFAIDVIWFDKDGTIVDLKSNMTPQSYPKVFLPDHPARYVLEIEGGMIKKTRVKIGDHAIIDISQ